MTTNISKLQEKANKEYPLDDIRTSVAKIEEYSGNEILLIKRSAFQNGYEICQKEYEEKLRFIPVEERLPEIGIWIIIKLKNQSLKNKYVTMLPKNDLEISFIKKNVISWRSFL